MSRMMAAHPTSVEFEGMQQAFKRHGKNLRIARRVGFADQLYSVYPWAGGYRVLSAWHDVEATLASLTAKQAQIDSARAKAKPKPRRLCA